MAKLTTKQQLFADDYVISHNATQSYMKIYKVKKEETAKVNGSRLLTKANVKEYVENKLKPKFAKYDITQERILQEYAKIAFLNPKQLFNNDGTLKGIHEIDDDSVAAINGVEVQEIFSGSGKEKEQIGTLHKLKIVDKKGALDSLAKIQGMFIDKVEHSGKITIDDLITGKAQ